LFIKKIGIDLGTANTLVFVPKRGLLINEPSIVAINLNDNRVVAVGRSAKEMIGRTPEDIVAHRPLKEGVIADYYITAAMLRYFIDKALGRFRVFKPDVVISVPAGITSTERRAVLNAAYEARVKNAYVVKEPILAALGAGIPINTPSGNMIVNIGGGTSEVAVISLGGIVAWASLRVAGDKFDQAIIDYVKKKYALAIGEQTAEIVKWEIGSALPMKSRLEFELRGRDLVTNLPKNITINSNEIAEALAYNLSEIVSTIKSVFHNTPPELAADVMEKGIIVSGGGAMLRGIDEYFKHALGVSTYIAEEPLFCVAKGAGVMLDHLDLYKRALIFKR